MYKYFSQPLKYSALMVVIFLPLISFLAYAFAFIGPLQGTQALVEKNSTIYSFNFNSPASVVDTCNWFASENLGGIGVVDFRDQQNLKLDDLLSFSLKDCKQFQMEIQNFVIKNRLITIEQLEIDAVTVFLGQNEPFNKPNSNSNINSKITRLTFKDWQNITQSATNAVDEIFVDGEFRLYLFSKDGLPFKLDPGHSWMTVAHHKNNFTKTISTFSSWPGKDVLSENNFDKKYFFNLATHNSIHINNPFDMETSQIYFDDTIASTNTSYLDLTRDQVKNLLFNQEWFVARNANPQDFLAEQRNIFLFSTDRSKRLQATNELINSTTTSTLNTVFWLTARTVINGNPGNNVAYDAIRSNCTSYVVDVWTQKGGYNYDYKFLGIVPAPSILYRSISD